MSLGMLFFVIALIFFFLDGIGAGTNPPVGRRWIAWGCSRLHLECF
jgi:hypothetical protein